MVEFVSIPSTGQINMFEIVLVLDSAMIFIYLEQNGCAALYVFGVSSFCNMVCMYMSGQVINITITYKYAQVFCT